MRIIIIKLWRSAYCLHCWHCIQTSFDGTSSKPRYLVKRLYCCVQGPGNTSEGSDLKECSSWQFFLNHCGTEPCNHLWLIDRESFDHHTLVGDSSVVRALGSGLNPCRSGGRIFFSRVDFLCWLLFQYLFHPCVTAVAHKRSRSFCPKAQVAGYS